MELYRYLNESHAIQALEDRALRVARIDALNDPYDCLPVVGNLPLPFGPPPDLGTKMKDFQDLVETTMLQFISSDIGIICYSASVRDPVVWSHYSDAHRGIALEFERTSELPVEEVDYRLERKVVPFEDFEKSYCTDAAELVKRVASFYTRKALSWAYKKEFRQFFQLRSCTPKKGYYFTELPHRSLRRVILGQRCNLKENYVIDLLDANRYQNIGVARAILNDSKYVMDIVESD